MLLRKYGKITVCYRNKQAKKHDRAFARIVNEELGVQTVVHNESVEEFKGELAFVDAVCFCSKIAKKSLDLDKKTR